MKKLVLTALAAAMATIGLASVASADSRYGDDEDWRYRRNHDGGDWNGRRDDDRDARRDDNDRNDWRWRNRDGWRDHHRPRWVYRDDFCFVKKIRRYDDWGTVYIKRVRICR